jgi:transposase
MGMRGSDAASGALFSYVDMEARVPVAHPLRTIRTIVNEVLDALDTEFEALYEGTGRLSVAPERLLRASLLQAFYSVRSERQLMEQINYNLLFRWFVGLGIDDAVWDHSTFSKNRERLLGADVAAKFLAAVLRHPKVTRFLSDEHFSVDGTLVEAWASLKSFRAKDGSDEPPAPGRNGERHFHNEKRSNETHASTTDPDARLYRKGSSQAAKLSYMGHALMENRHGLVVGATLTPATGTAEREAAIKMIVRRSPGARRLTLGADKGYDTKNFVADLRDLNVAPHVAQNTTNRVSAIDGRTTRHPGYAASQIIRKRIEESFAWTKTIAGLHKTKHRGVGRVAFQFVFAMAAYQSDPDAQITIDRRLRPIICQKQTIKLIQPIRSGIQHDATKENKENTALLRRQVQRPASSVYPREMAQ